MPVTPAGELSLVLENLKILIAASTSFQTLVGAANATEARGSIFKFWADDNQARPRAIIGHGNGLEIEKASTTSWKSRGPLWIDIEIDTPEEFLQATSDDAATIVAKREDAGVTFTNAIGGLIDNIKTLSVAGSGLLAVDLIDVQLLGYAEPRENNGQQFWYALLDVSFRGL